MINTPDHPMHRGKVYHYDDKDLMEQQEACLEVIYDFNRTRPSQGELRLSLMKKIFAEVGGNCWIEPPFHANWGIHTHLGDRVYANFNFTLVAVGNPCRILRKIGEEP